MDSEFLPEEDFGEDFGEKMDSPNEIPIRLSPRDDFQRTNFPADGQLRVIEVSSVPNLHSALAEASQEEERRKSTPDLSIVSRVREVSVESLMDWAHSFFDSRQCEPVQQQNQTNTPLFGPVVENYYDLFAQKLNDAQIESLSKGELETAIDTLKDQILALPSDKNDSERTHMVQQLILLRLKIQEIEDFNPKSTGMTSMGHHFTPSPLFRHMSKRGRHCEVCGQLLIFAPSQFDCSACGFVCHERCISSIARVCVAEQLQLKAEFLLDICPEKGLDAQNFACAECRKTFPMEKNDLWLTQLIRLCDYNGKYYCNVCHRNDLDISPGRVMKNWDFSPRPVSRVSKQILQILASLPILNIMEINRDLLTQVEGICCVQEIRSRLAILQRMMLDCEEGPQIALLRKLSTGRKHLLTKNFLYSLNDLIDINREVLPKELTVFADELEGHVRVTCPSCVRLATLCATCGKDGDKMYAFEGRASPCAACGATMHKTCFALDPLCVKCRTKARL